MVEADCLFCKISAGGIPAGLVYETENVVGFRDINPEEPKPGPKVSRQRGATM